jgi:hypothetical protein
MMDWTQVLTIFGGNIAMFLWAVRQGRSDFLHLDKKIDENRRENMNFLKAIQDEMKDFHNRLCKIEEGRK